MELTNDQKIAALSVLAPIINSGFHNEATSAAVKKAAKIIESLEVVERVNIEVSIKDIKKRRRKN